MIWNFICVYASPDVILLKLQQGSISVILAYRYWHDYIEVEFVTVCNITDKKVNGYDVRIGRIWCKERLGIFLGIIDHYIVTGILLYLGGGMRVCYQYFGKYINEFLCNFQDDFRTSSKENGNIVRMYRITTWMKSFYAVRGGGMRPRNASLYQLTRHMFQWVGGIHTQRKIWYLLTCIHI